MGPRSGCRNTSTSKSKQPFGAWNCASSQRRASDGTVDRLVALPTRRASVRTLASEAWALRHNITIGDALFVVMARHLHDRVREEPDSVATRSSNALGAWYATVLFWNQRLALFVNETTLLPVFVPLAPAATVIDRFTQSTPHSSTLNSPP